MAKTQPVAFGRTELGQSVYDIYFSKMSAAEVVRRHPTLTREWVLAQRKSKTAKKIAANRAKP
jgi:hypothetical protein